MKSISILSDVHHHWGVQPDPCIWVQFTQWEARYQGLEVDLREAVFSSTCLIERINLPQIIEGAITLFLGVLTWFFVPDFPDRNKFLTPEQTALVLKRVEDDRGDSIPDTLTFRKVVTHLGDWTLWCYGQLFLSMIHPSDNLSILSGIMLMCATLPACKDQ